jgi:hypothetical protein
MLLILFLLTDPDYQNSILIKGDERGGQDRGGEEKQRPGGREGKEKGQKRRDGGEGKRRRDGEITMTEARGAFRFFFA